jgi:short-subunit dehydrogenase
VVIVASVAGSVGTPLSLYAATKGSTCCWAGLAAELRGDGVDVLTLAPGTTHRVLDPGRPRRLHGPDAADVVATALSRLGRADVVVPGWFYRGGTFAMRFLPRGVNRAVFGRLLAAMRTEE